MSMPTSSFIVRDSINEPRRSKRRRLETSFGHDFLHTFFTEDFNVNFLTDEPVSAFFIEEDPNAFAKAMRSLDASFWKEAIKSELDSTMSNQTWELVDLPKGSRPITSK